MATDLAMLDSTEPVARVYTWTGPWISIGRFQREDRVAPEGALVVRRPTGGKAVQHGGDITVAIASPLLSGEDERNLKGIYRRLATPIRDAFQLCGLDAEFASDLGSDRGGTGEDCFAFRTAYDLVDSKTRRKLCGCALRVTHEAALLQVSIPMHPIESMVYGYVATEPVSVAETRLCECLRLSIRNG